MTLRLRSVLTADTSTRPSAGGRRQTVEGGIMYNLNDSKEELDRLLTVEIINYPRSLLHHFKIKNSNKYYIVLENTLNIVELIAVGRPPI